MGQHVLTTKHAKGYEGFGYFILFNFGLFVTFVVKILFLFSCSFAP
jgi:hypothetical protein